MLIYLINKPAVVLVELRRAVEMINKPAVVLVELCRAVEMLSGSE